MAYTPELSDYHSGTLGRIAWALGKPMTKTLHTLFDSLDLIIEPGKVCKKCKDRSLCDACYFRTGKRINEQIPIDPLKHNRAGVHDLSACNLPTDQSGQAGAQAGTAGISTEVEMKVNQVSVLVSKKTCPPMPYHLFCFVELLSVHLAKMEIKSSVGYGRRVGKNFCSWSLSYGATAEVEEEHFSPRPYPNWTPS